MAQTTVKILQRGDKVISITESHIGIKRKSGGAYLYPLYYNEGSLCLATDNVLHIAYCNDAVETIIDGENGEVTIIEFN